MSMSEITIDNTRFVDNNYVVADRASSDRETQGNFLHIVLGVTLTVKRSYFSSGLAQQGGAVYLQGLSEVSFESCRFIDNYATNFGGAIFANGYSYLSITTSTFTNNEVGSIGSDLYA